MAGRKKIVETPMQYAALLTKMEGGKSQIKVGDMRQALRLMRALETSLILSGYRSALLMIRREAVEQAKKIRAKKLK